jgi:transcription elongation factor GreA
MKQIKFTKQGLESVLKEKSKLQEIRKEAVQLLKTAREMGDLSENSAYRAAKHKLSSIDYRLRYLEMLMMRGVVAEKKEGVVDIGSIVYLNNGHEEIIFSIVGGHESDILNKKISLYSPLGKALVGKKQDESVEVAGVTYIILKII